MAGIIRLGSYQLPMWSWILEKTPNINIFQIQCNFYPFVYRHFNSYPVSNKLLFVADIEYHRHQPLVEMQTTTHHVVRKTIPTPKAQRKSRKSGQKGFKNQISRSLAISNVFYIYQGIYKH